MLKDLSSHPEDEFAPECSASEHRDSDGREMERGGAQFRASLWLGIAADLRRERASRSTKGQVSC
jgi:hypothetical protein